MCCLEISLHEVVTSSVLQVAGGSTHEVLLTCLINEIVNLTLTWKAAFSEVTKVLLKLALCSHRLLFIVAICLFELLYWALVSNGHDFILLLNCWEFIIILLRFLVSQAWIWTKCMLEVGFLSRWFIKSVSNIDSSSSLLWVRRLHITHILSSRLVWTHIGYIISNIQGVHIHKVRTIGASRHRWLNHAILWIIIIICHLLLGVNSL